MEVEEKRVTANHGMQLASTWLTDSDLPSKYLLESGKQSFKYKLHIRYKQRSVRSAMGMHLECTS